MKLLELLKSKKGLSVAIAIFIIGVIIGFIASPECSKDTHEGIESYISELENDLEEKENNINNLNKKLSEAEPYFKMSDAEKESIKIETAKKEEQNKIEREKLEKEQKEREEAQKQAELDARSITLGNGTYIIGKDIPEGVYDLYAVKGGGNVQSPGQINVIMGVKGDDDFYQREEQNVALASGTSISLRNVTIKFVPDDGYTLKN